MRLDETLQPRSFKFILRLFLRCREPPSTSKEANALLLPLLLRDLQDPELLGSPAVSEIHIPLCITAMVL